MHSLDAIKTDLANLERIVLRGADLSVFTLKAFEFNGSLHLGEKSSKEEVRRTVCGNVLPYAGPYPLDKTYTFEALVDPELSFCLDCLPLFWETQEDFRLSWFTAVITEVLQIEGLVKTLADTPQDVPLPSNVLRELEEITQDGSPGADLFQGAYTGKHRRVVSLLTDIFGPEEVSNFLSIWERPLLAHDVCWLSQSLVSSKKSQTVFAPAEVIDEQLNDAEGFGVLLFLQERSKTRTPVLLSSLFKGDPSLSAYFDYTTDFLDYYIGVNSMEEAARSFLLAKVLQTFNPNDEAIVIVPRVVAEAFRERSEIITLRLSEKPDLKVVETFKVLGSERLSPFESVAESCIRDIWATALALEGF